MAYKKEGVWANEKEEGSGGLDGGWDRERKTRDLRGDRDGERERKGKRGEEGSMDVVK